MSALAHCQNGCLSDDKWHYILMTALIGFEFNTFYNNIDVITPRNFYQQTSYEMSDNSAYVLVLAFVTCNLFFNPLTIYFFLRSEFFFNCKKHLSRRLCGSADSAQHTPLPQKKIIPEEIAFFVSILGPGCDAPWADAAKQINDNCRQYNRAYDAPILREWIKGEMFNDSAFVLPSRPVPLIDSNYPFECTFQDPGVFLLPDYKIARNYILVYLTILLINNSYAAVDSFRYSRSRLQCLSNSIKEKLLEYNRIQNLQSRLRSLPEHSFERFKFYLNAVFISMSVIILLGATYHIFSDKQSSLQGLETLSNSLSADNSTVLLQKLEQTLIKGNATLGNTLLFKPGSCQIPACKTLFSCRQINFDGELSAKFIASYKKQCHVALQSIVQVPGVWRSEADREYLAMASSIKADLCVSRDESMTKAIVTRISTLEITAKVPHIDGRLDSFYKDYNVSRSCRYGDDPSISALMSTDDVFSLLLITAIGGLEIMFYLPMYLLAFYRSAVLIAVFYTERFATFIKAASPFDIPLLSDNLNKKPLPELWKLFLRRFYKLTPYIGGAYAAMILMLPLSISVYTSGSLYDTKCFLEMLFKMRFQQYGVRATCDVEKAQDFMTNLPFVVAIVFPTTSLLLSCSAIYACHAAKLEHKAMAESGASASESANFNRRRANSL